MAKSPRATQTAVPATRIAPEEVRALNAAGMERSVAAEALGRAQRDHDQKAGAHAFLIRHLWATYGLTAADEIATDGTIRRGVRPVLPSLPAPPAPPRRPR